MKEVKDMTEVNEAKGAKEMKEIIIPERRIYVYSYAELSEESKGTAKQFYLDGQEPETFQDIYEEDLKNLFPRSDLKIEFSLNGCQGDGLNIYGKLDPKDVIGVLHDIAERFSGRLTEKEERTILHYDAETEYEIELPQNTRYAYCVAYLADFAEDWQEELENTNNLHLNLKPSLIIHTCLLQYKQVLYQ